MRKVVLLQSIQKVLLFVVKGTMTANKTFSLMIIMRVIRRMVMEESNGLRHLQNQIRIFEDMLLRSKNRFDQEKLEAEISKMRVQLQKAQYQS